MAKQFEPRGAGSNDVAADVAVLNLGFLSTRGTLGLKLQVRTLQL